MEGFIYRSRSRRSFVLRSSSSMTFVSGQGVGEVLFKFNEFNYFCFRPRTWRSFVQVQWVQLLLFQAKELEDFCFKFSMNHMTAVAQTEAFTKLDESTVKDFITKVAQFVFYNLHILYTLYCLLCRVLCSVLCTNVKNNNIMLKYVALWYSWTYLSKKYNFIFL